MAEPKKRHGCLTAVLILLILGTSISALTYLFGGGYVRRSVPNMPGWLMVVFFLLSVFNFVCTIALFKWKKWGFWGICGSVLLSVILNLTIGMGILSLVGGAISIGILYGVLQIGGVDKGWPQLE